MLNEELLKGQIDELFKTMVQASEQELNVAIKLIRDITYSNQVSENSVFSCVRSIW